MGAARKKARRGGEGTAGPRVHLLSVVSTAFVAVFVLAVVTLVAADFLYAHPARIIEVLRQKEVLAAIRLTIITSIITLYLVVLFSVPIGYALSRYRFPGRLVADTIVDLPMVLPPLVVGVSLLVFFGTAPGRWIQDHVGKLVFTQKGIVLCQFFVAVSYGIRAAKAAFDQVDERLEHLALTLGCTRARAFRTVALPLARDGLIAGAIMGWARAVGVFGPLMVFAGAVRMKTEVMATSIYLELSVGRVEHAIAVALVMVLMAFAALVSIHWLAGSRRRWWGT